MPNPLDLTLNEPIRPPQEIVRGVAWIRTMFVNAYMVGDVGGPWVLVDTGLPRAAERMRRAAAARFAERWRPEAIVLTHGHFDHSGSALELGRSWDVPIYAHRLELPYLTGKSNYPPKDPTVGGALGLMSRLFPDHGYDFGARVQALPEDGSIPGVEGWRWLHTPGHTAGHVALYRERDRVLIVGDALTTVDTESAASLLWQKPELRGPAAPFTSDWISARRSVEQLAALRPSVIAAGHGVPMCGANVAEELAGLAARFEVPAKGRYSEFPAITNEHGVQQVPPAPPDRLPKYVAGAAAASVAGLAIAALVRHKRREG